MRPERGWGDQVNIFVVSAVLARYRYGAAESIDDHMPCARRHRANAPNFRDRLGSFRTDSSRKKKYQRRAFLALRVALPTVASKVTPATAALTKSNVPFTVHTYEVDPAAAAHGAAYGPAAAAALGAEPERVFKTLVVTVDGRLAVGVVPVSGALDLKRLAVALGGKRAAMAEPADAERATGYVTGGISPVGQRTRLPIVVDASADRWASVFVSGGRRGMQLELRPADLVTVTGAVVAGIATR